MGWIYTVSSELWEDQARAKEEDKVWASQVQSRLEAERFEAVSAEVAEAAACDDSNSSQTGMPSLPTTPSSSKAAWRM